MAVSGFIIVCAAKVKLLDEWGSERYRWCMQDPCVMH